MPSIRRPAEEVPQQVVEEKVTVKMAAHKRGDEDARFEPYGVHVGDAILNENVVGDYVHPCIERGDCYNEEEAEKYADWRKIRSGGIISADERMEQALKLSMLQVHRQTARCEKGFSMDEAKMQKCITDHMRMACDRFAEVDRTCKEKSVRMDESHEGRALKVCEGRRKRYLTSCAHHTQSFLGSAQRTGLGRDSTCEPLPDSLSAHCLCLHGMIARKEAAPITTVENGCLALHSAMCRNAGPRSFTLDLLLLMVQLSCDHGGDARDIRPVNASAQLLRPSARVEATYSTLILNTYIYVLHFF